MEELKNFTSAMPPGVNTFSSIHISSIPGGKNYHHWSNLLLLKLKMKSYKCECVSITPQQTSWRTQFFNLTTEPAVECLMLNNVDGSEPKAEADQLYICGKPVADHRFKAKDALSFSILRNQPIPFSTTGSWNLFMRWSDSSECGGNNDQQKS